jgi:hypothetical protein
MLIGGRRVGVAIDNAQVDRSRGAAGRASNPQEPVTGQQRGADRWGEQQGHPPGLAFVPGDD